MALEYIAGKKMTLPDGTKVTPGDIVPGADQWRHPERWVNSGHLVILGVSGRADLVNNAISESKKAKATNKKKASKKAEAASE